MTRGVEGDHGNAREVCSHGGQFCITIQRSLSSMRFLCTTTGCKLVHRRTNPSLREHLGRGRAVKIGCLEKDRGRFRMHI